MEPKVHKIAVFASGKGTNAEKIFEYFSKHEKIEVALLLTNKPHAEVIQRAERFNIPVEIFNKDKFYNSNEILTLLKEFEIEWIILAGFLWIVPGHLIDAYRDRILNLHPALLPKFGGKGMYGMNVHRAVVNQQEDETGISIHFANEEYDQGKLIFQARCPVHPEDSPEDVAQRVQRLEHHYFPRIAEDTILQRPVNSDERDL